MARVPTEPSSMRRGRAARKTRSAPSDNVPQAMISAAAGPVTVEIGFGHAQHGTYTIQLFDPSGTSELARLTGLSTDDIADQIALKPSPSQLDRHILQWSGAVDAFSPSPGQQFSVVFDVRQDGHGVPGGHIEKTGPLTVTQAFLGILRLISK